METYPRPDPVLHLTGTIVRGGAVGIAGLSIGSLSSIAWVEGDKLVEEDGELGSAVEEDNEHGSCEADCKGKLVLVHGCWREPVKDALPCMA